MDNNVIAVVAGKEITEEDFKIFANGFTPEQKAYLQNPEILVNLAVVRWLRSLKTQHSQQKQQEVYNAKVEELKAKYCK